MALPKKRTVKKIDKSNYITCANKNCEREGELQNPTNFYKSKSPLMDKYPVCKKCIEKAIDIEEISSVCTVLKQMDIPFVYDVWNLSLMNNQNAPFGEYLINIDKYQNNKYKKVGYEASVFEPEQIMPLMEQNESEEDEEEIDEELIYDWGNGFKALDYKFLEHRLKEWQRSYKCDTQAELSLLRQMCLSELDIRQAREEKNDTRIKEATKTFQDLMKTAAIDPAKGAVANAGKAKESFGAWIKDIEEFRPAEYYKDKEKYKDIDGMETYIQDYIIRAMKNFMFETRDFEIHEDLGDSGDVLGES